MTLLLTLLASILVSASGIAWAIVNGIDDTSNRFSRVGALYDAGYAVGDPINSGAYCSGVLISPSVFLTAKHCGTNDSTVAVTFDPYGANNPSKPYFPKGTFKAADKAVGDIAVVLLGESVDPNMFPNEPEVVLPTQKGEFSPPNGLLAVGNKFTAVGYGMQQSDCDRPRKPQCLYQRRYTKADNTALTVASLNQVNDKTATLSQKTGSGTCLGDSGGPVFSGLHQSQLPPADAGGNKTLVGITTSGDGACRNTTIIQRLDTDAVNNFLQDKAGIKMW